MHEWETSRWQNMLAHFELKDGLVTKVKTEGHTIFPESSLFEITLMEAVDKLGQREVNLGCWRMSGVVSWTEEKVSLWFTRELEMIEVKVEGGGITEISGQIPDEERQRLMKTVGGLPLSIWVFNVFTMTGGWNAGAELTVAVSHFDKNIVNDTVCFTRIKLH